MRNRFRQVKTRENLTLIFNALPIAEPAEPRTDIFPRYGAFVVRKEDVGRRHSIAA